MNSRLDYLIFCEIITWFCNKENPEMGTLRNINGLWLDSNTDMKELFRQFNEEK
jgi:hypothetical protein